MIRRLASLAPLLVFPSLSFDNRDKPVERPGYQIFNGRIVFLRDFFPYAPLLVRGQNHAGLGVCRGFRILRDAG